MKQSPFKNEIKTKMIYLIVDIYRDYNSNCLKFHPKNIKTTVIVGRNCKLHHVNKLIDKIDLLSMWWFMKTPWLN